MLYLPHLVLIGSPYTALTGCVGANDEPGFRPNSDVRCLLLYDPHVRGLLYVTYHIAVRCELGCTRALCYTS